ncbi:MAG: undecaprenyldiphospho-muramoylpentapeptide beta-N-acetylglucosaminyltransferase [candidate division Zixibacteria bacterium]|nr:undecaprenyldiphospho-muramoylpentapeptide beta-N-acetylglucosaminyltransferase [candidate division Zixibacteria bacterium]
MRVLMAAGGTGGHLIPAIRIAEAVRRQRSETELLFMGGDRGFEEDVITRRGERYIGLPARGFARKRIVQNVRAVFSNWRAQRMGNRAVSDFVPDVAVGCGGYASYFPIRAARAQSIPYVLQEQNRIPGLATRWLSAGADTVFTAFEQTADALSKAKSISLVGNPIDPRLAQLGRDEARAAWTLNADERVVLVTGGSGGAQSINANIIKGLESITPDQPVTVLWQTGRHRVEWSGNAQSGWTVREFVFTDQMTEAFIAADLIIARAGALTISEIAAVGRPAILVPFPFATADHQTQNARVLVDAGGAELITDPDLADVSLLSRALEMLDDSDRLAAMGEGNRRLGKPNAADEIATYVIALAERSHRGDDSRS